MLNNENSVSNEQLELMNAMDRRFRVGDEVTGEILSITRDGITISLVGYKTDGIIPLKEITSKEDPELFLERLNVGDSIKAKVIQIANKDNLVVLSRLEYEKEEAIEELRTIFNENKSFEIKISEIKENGLVGFYKGIRIFIPASQIDVMFIKNKEEFLNKIIEVKLIEFKLERPLRIVASRRIIQEVIQKEKEEKAWSSLNIGDIVKGEVKRFTDFGAFVEVNGVDGLVHLSQISWNHVKKAQDYLKAGDIIDVKIIDMDRENKKLSLSIKELTPEPWSNINEKYPEDSIVLGKVVRLNDFGAFVELEPGIDGLVHISKISHNRIDSPKDVLSVGEEIKARILSVDGENKRISLSIKDV